MKKKAISRSAQLTLEERHYGPEPVFLGELTDSQFSTALNWYNYMHTVDTGKKWLFQYLKQENKNQLIARLRSLPDWRIPTTSCWVARMCLNGTVFSKPVMDRFYGRLTDAANHAEIAKEAKAEETNVVSIQDRVRAKIDQLITDCEEALDNDPNLDIYTWLQNKEATQQAATTLCDYYLKSYLDWETPHADVIDVCGKKKFKEHQEYWTDFITNVDRYIQNKKVVKVRKPKTFKAKTAVDLVKNVKYASAFPELKLVSAAPANIVGATSLWVYNHKYRVLGVYHTNNPKGLSVKGTTITGFDPDLSIGKKLRKPEEVLPQVMSAGKVTQRNLLGGIKTAEIKLTGRINSDTILLRVIK